MTVAIIVVVLLIVILTLVFVGVRNGMIRARLACEQAWSDIDVQLKRRHDLVPNLVATVKGYAAHERGVFEKVAEARAAAMAAHDPGQSAQAEQALTGALVDLRAVAENYPQLRATENFRQLAARLTEIEGEIQAARDTYNAHVQAYNTKIQIFPNSLIAHRGGFQPGQFFAIEEGERAPAAVGFGA